MIVFKGRTYIIRRHLFMHEKKKKQRNERNGYRIKQKWKLERRHFQHVYNPRKYMYINAERQGKAQYSFDT